MVIFFKPSQLALLELLQWRGGKVPQGTSIYYKQNFPKKFKTTHPKKYNIISINIYAGFTCV